jgi:hypothetical protein
MQTFEDVFDTLREFSVLMLRFMIVPLIIYLALRVWYLGLHDINSTSWLLWTPLTLIIVFRLAIYSVFGSLKKQTV